MNHIWERATFRGLWFNVHIYGVFHICDEHFWNIYTMFPIQFYSKPIYVKCLINATPLDVFHFICFGTWSLNILRRVTSPCCMNGCAGRDIVWLWSRLLQFYVDCSNSEPWYQRWLLFADIWVESFWSVQLGRSDLHARRDCVVGDLFGAHPSSILWCFLHHASHVHSRVCVRGLARRRFRKLLLLRRSVAVFHRPVHPHGAVAASCQYSLRTGFAVWICGA